MTATRDNHYVPQWYQKGFISNGQNKLCHLTQRKIKLPNSQVKNIQSKKWFTTAQRFYEVDLYSTFFGSNINDEIEKKLFGPIDDNGAKAIKAFIGDDVSEWHHNFESLFTYLDAQKLRTPKGLEWIQSKYPKLDQKQLMIEMQELRTMHCTLWAEGVREFVSAKDSNVKFIVSDHPVTVYNHACPPGSDLCNDLNDPDTSLKATQTIFPLNQDRCLILTNVEYAKDHTVDPLQQRINANRMRQSMVNTIEFINSRSLNDHEVTQINHIIKSRSKSSIAAGKEEWLFPNVESNWSELRHVLIPPENELGPFGAEMYAHYEDGTVVYQDAFGRKNKPSKFLNKSIKEESLGRNNACGCGSGKKYKTCCQSMPKRLRATWEVLSVRERQLAFCNCIVDILGLERGKSWDDVKRDITESQISDIYSYYARLWPTETDIYSLLPKPDGKFRGLYSGSLDVRTILFKAVPMATYFDEFLIESPITNPNNVTSKFNPVESPESFKYQAIKEFMFILTLEPYIQNGSITLVPDISDFDMLLKKDMFELARDRGITKTIFGKREYELNTNLMIEDLMNSTAMKPIDVQVSLLINEFNLTEKSATDLVNHYRSNSNVSPLMMLQDNVDSVGQLFLVRMGPNYEMSLLTGQVTGSVLVTDSNARWKELLNGQHKSQGLTIHPWNDLFKNLKSLPMDEGFLNQFRKSIGTFSVIRDFLKQIDQIVQKNISLQDKLSEMIEKGSHLSMTNCEADKTSQAIEISIRAPQGGVYDKTVQRLLARSGCQLYDHTIRSIYGLDIKN